MHTDPNNLKGNFSSNLLKVFQSEMAYSNEMLHTLEKQNFTFNWLETFLLVVLFCIILMMAQYTFKKFGQIMRMIEGREKGKSHEYILLDNEIISAEQEDHEV